MGDRGRPIVVGREPVGLGNWEESRLGTTKWAPEQNFTYHLAAYHLAPP